ncbi:MAG: formylglycine-generating enzyme family protein [Fibrobacteria bacterium]
MFKALPPLLWFLPLSALVWFGCDAADSLPSAPGDAKVMVYLHAIGRQTQLGSLEPFANEEEESPRLTARFSYDFRIDRTEVTQAEYERIMGRNPATEPFGLGPDFPVYNVSFYDAALFCNARSKAEKKDTVYEYAGREADGKERAYGLPGLVIHYERDGYRLPTEAEWEFAARGGVETAFPWGDGLDSLAVARMAWFNGNAAGKAHAVAKNPANAFGLYDMLGNVMEWTNDWKSPYAPVTVQDFLGSRNPGLIQERSVKGGSYAYDARYLRYSARSANYATLSSSAVDYIGFRCVLGHVASGQYLDGGRSHRATPPVIADREASRTFFGHTKVKLVFVNATSFTRTLCYIDFSEQPTVVHEFLDDSAVFTPVISPDGMWVAYGNVDEGSRLQGSVSIRRLQQGSQAVLLPVESAAIPRWWVDPGGSDTCLVFATLPVDNTDPVWPSSRTFRIKVSAGAAAGPPEPLATGGYHDGLSENGNYLASGFRWLHLRNRNSGSDRVLFTGPSNGKEAGDTSQVCNVSMQPHAGPSPELLMLDFGYEGVSTVVGRPYGLHEILFRVDTLGRVVSWYRAPKGFQAWQDAEWSNQADFAVAAGESAGSGYPAVVALNLRDSVTTVLARGSTLGQPALWINPGAVVFPAGGVDSLGLYDEPAGTIQQMQFACKMKILWLNRRTAEVVGLGSSHVMAGIWPQSFTHYRALNLGYYSAGIKGAVEMATNYVLPNFPSLRALIIEVQPGWMNADGGDFIWSQSMAKTKGYRYDSTHGFWPSGIPPALDTIMLAFSNPLTAGVDGAGGLQVPGHDWGVRPPPVLPDFFTPQSAGDANAVASIGLLRSLAESSKRKGIHLVLTLFPQSPAYRNTPYYGKYGPTWEVGRALVENVKSICAGNPFCHFYDANQEGNHDYPDSMAGNEDHLSFAGARQISHRLDSLIYRAVEP